MKNAEMLTRILIVSFLIRYKLMELICYTVMGVFPALVILSMVSDELAIRFWCFIIFPL